MLYSSEQNLAYQKMDESAKSTMPSSASPSSSTNRVNWNQHPVIATVLWILGSEDRASPSPGNLHPISSLETLNKVKFSQRITDLSDNTSTNNYSNKKNSLTTSAEEDFDSQSSLVQDLDTTVITTKTISTIQDEIQQQDQGTQLYPTNATNNHPNSHLPSHISSNTPNHCYHSTNTTTTAASASYNADNHENENQWDVNPSPQWGFYVPITPPQQEMYAAIKKDLMTIQAMNNNNSNNNSNPPPMPLKSSLKKR
jgi:hypothetical protein